MSTEIYDIKDEEAVSSCCGAPMYTDMDICSDCKEHCDSVSEE